MRCVEKEKTIDYEKLTTVTINSLNELPYDLPRYLRAL